MQYLHEQPNILIREFLIKCFSSSWIKSISSNKLFRLCMILSQLMELFLDESNCKQTQRLLNVERKLQRDLVVKLPASFGLLFLKRNSFWSTLQQGRRSIDFLWSIFDAFGSTAIVIGSQYNCLILCSFLILTTMLCLIDIWERNDYTALFALDLMKISLDGIISICNWLMVENERTMLVLVFRDFQNIRKSLFKYLRQEDLLRGFELG